MQPRPGDLVPIDESECVELLGAAPWVRIGFIAGDRPVVLPVNVVLHDGAVYFRTAPGSKLASAASEGPVTVEADGGDAGARVGWSVVVQGRASIVTDDDLVAELYALPFEPWALPGTDSFWVQITVDAISGRRVVR